MKKILILNGSHSEIPLIKAAKDMGLFVITTGNNPELSGHKLSNKYINADYSDCEKILELAKQEEIDYICSSANDFGIITASYVAEKLGLGGHDSYETTLRLHHKDQFKEMVNQYDLLSAKGRKFKNKDEAIEYASSLDYPVMIKPVDLTGGKGVTKATTKEEKIEGINKAFDMGRDKTIVIEQFIEGTYHSMDTYIVNKKVVSIYSDNEYAHYNPFYCAISGGPADDFELVKEDLVKEFEKVANILNLVDGKLHCQYIMTKDYKPYVIEFSRRLSGDMYGIPVKRAVGIDDAKLTIMSECGMDISKEVFIKEQKKNTGRYIMQAPHNGTVTDVLVNPEFEKHIYDKYEWWQSGFEINDYYKDKLGVIFYEFEDREEMIKSINNIDRLITFKYKEGD